MNDQREAREKHQTCSWVEARRPTLAALFILAIDPLQRIIDMAADKGFLQPVLPKTAKLRCSLYADDAAIFTAPTADDLSRLSRILHTFGECSGLSINMAKTEIFPIRMDPSTVQNLSKFSRKDLQLPGEIELPLHTRKLRKVEIQPLIDKIGSRLPGWQGKLLSMAGRETLVKTVLSSQPIYHLTASPAQKWLIKSTDKIKRSFLWRGE